MKSILLHVQSDAGMEARLQAALAIARAHGGHVSCLHVTPINLYIVSDGVYGAYLMPDFATRLDEMEAKIRADIEGRLKNEDVSFDYQQITGDPAQELISRSALVDLIVLGRYHHQETRYTPLTLIGDVLNNARVPVLVQPQEKAAFDPFGSAIVAWNGSLEAANALRGALPMLRKASAVHVVTVEEPKENELPPLAASEYLARHDIKSELHPLTKSEIPVAEAIVSTAQVMKAAYIVMGGYGHSRAREYLFGGVTRDLLTESPIPLLMAH
jgi:nucleotide-binding universal stress UspA family protein